MNYRRYQITQRVKHFLHKPGEIRNADLIFIFGAQACAVAGRIRDTGRKVLKFSFETGNTSSHIYSNIFRPYRIPRGGIYLEI
jgi:hypothetical protein